jgi:peptide/nickel transport system substrate-binding protein
MNHSAYRLTLRRALLLALATSPLSTAMAQTGPTTSARVLKVAAPWEIGSLDPSKTGYIFTRLEVTETLVDVDASGQLSPGLAAHWSVSPDQKTWRFPLRAGAIFHDGSVVTPEAVMRSLERALAQPGILKGAPIQKNQREQRGSAD